MTYNGTEYTEIDRRAVPPGTTWVGPDRSTERSTIRTSPDGEYAWATEVGCGGDVDSYYRRVRH